ncbi:Transglutaminase-like enzyme, putative cysteine protease [Faunimonas pinastri]|uniref:Transglutaminase-like enzyme, putative cysteine protease n=1 Tax=Faunimonas pinastri TaxID=1855383 RepID=A0A1H9NU49_9HYPH|nr:transglutaminase family protein [Faunimonas pinastri]SER39564.1 Transglutaminase-like enzyme, putative cysteine protease [Faunimonas pinastri]
MPILTVRHVTTYKYRQPVAFGEHRMTLRPQGGLDQRLLDFQLKIAPEPASLRWYQDVFGNSVAVARFATRSAELRFESIGSIEHTVRSWNDFQPAPYAQTWPFSYGSEEMPDLVRSVERQYSDPDQRVDNWARRFLRPEGRTATLDLLSAMTQAIRREFSYNRRMEKGIQSPVETLRLEAGTCRDFAVLMMEAVRSLGLAARFVSGYIYVPSREGRGHLGGGSTHAWLQVYVPGIGWMDFDPTNAIIGNRDLIRVAVARDPRQILPLGGSWTGFPGDFLDMDVSVHVSSDEANAGSGPIGQRIADLRA